MDSMLVRDALQLPSGDYEDDDTVADARRSMQSEWMEHQSGEHPDDPPQKWVDHDGPEGHIRHLRREIAQHGLQHPIEVTHREDGPVLTDGHHTLFAAHDEGLPDVPVHHIRSHRTAAIDGPDWCAHRREARCFYPGDRLPDGTRLGIPQDRGPCPWVTINQQAMCPISEPGPMAAQFRTGAAMESATDALDRINRSIWSKVRAEHQSVHRGFGMELDDEDHALVHDTSRPLHERASHLLHLAATGDHGWGREHSTGLGTHWSTDANVAHHFAKTDARERQKYDWSRDGEEHGHNADGLERQRPETRVVMHAHFPEHEHIAHDEEDQDGAFGYDERNTLHPVNSPGEYEREVPIKRRQPVHVHAISWGRQSHITDDEAPHDRETTRYDFPEPMTHKAVRKMGKLGAREPGSVDCWVCGGSGMDDTEGMECGACDGSGYLTPGEQREGDGVRCPCGEKVHKDTSGDLTHLDGSVSHNDGESVAEKMRGARTAAKGYPPRHHENGGVPFKRIFGPTHGLDHRLFDGERLKRPLREDLMAKWHEFCEAFGLYDPDEWSVVYFAGSEASEWTGENREGNNDFDILVGVSLPLFCAGGYGETRQGHAARMGWPLTQEGLAAGLTAKLKATLVDPHYRLPGKLDDGSEFDQTWYVNPGSYRIVDIKPYAAYDVTHDRWAVKPPHLPGWSIKDFPEGPALEEYCWGVEDMARATLDMPEPYRHQEGFALWHFIHDERSGAFGPQGEGWYDVRNVVEKWLDQKGLMPHLWTLMHEAVQDPHLLDAPADWSNTPVMAMLLHSALLDPSCPRDDLTVVLRATGKITTPEVRAVERRPTHSDP